MAAQLAQVFAQAAKRHEAARQPGAQSLADPPLELTHTIQDLLHLHGQHSCTAVILLVMAVACVLPVGGVGTVLSFAMVLLAWRWARRLETDGLPQRLARVRLSPRWTLRSLRGFAWLYGTAASCLRPRWQALTADATRPWWALWITCMALLIFLPIPFGNILPAMSLAALSLGWMFRDGLVLLLSKLLGLVALAFVLSLGHVAWGAAQKLNPWV